MAGYEEDNGDLPGAKLARAFSTNLPISSTNLTATNIVTGATGSFGVLQITSANASGATGVTAALGPTGAADGGPATTAQNGWAVLYVNGTKCWVPVWV